MATYEQLMDAARKAHANNKPEHAKRFLELAKQAQGSVSHSNRMRQNVARAKEMVAAGYSPEAPTWETMPQADKEAIYAMSGGRLKANLIGDVDPTTQNPGEVAGSLVQKATESATLGLVGDEANARLDAALTGQNYGDRLAHYRDQEAQVTQNHPGKALAAELAPMALPVAGAGQWVARGSNAAAKMARGASLAAAQGGAYGFMEGEGDMSQRAQQGSVSAAISGGIGAMAHPVASGVQRWRNSKAQKQVVKAMMDKAPSADTLKSRAGELYRSGEAVGQVMDAKAAQSLLEDATAALKREGVMRADGSLITRDPDAKRILDELQDLAQFGLQGNQVKPVRELFTSAAQDRNPARARIGKILRDKFDAAVNHSAPQFRQGDELYSRAKKVDAVDQMVDLADTSDAANALRNEFKKADRKSITGRFGPMTDDELAAMQRVSRGSRVEAAARGVGKSAPQSLGSAIFTGGMPTLAGSIAGNPQVGMMVGGGALAAGALARGISNRTQSKNADIARALMATGGQMPKATAPDGLSKLISELLMRGAPRAGTFATGGL